MGADQCIAAFIEEQRAQSHKYQEEMRDLRRANAEQTAATQQKLDALIREVTALPEGAQVLRNAFAPANPMCAAGDSTAGATEPGGAETEAAPESPSGAPPKVGAPPAPEHSDGLDGCCEPATLPSVGSPSENEHITTSPRRPFAGFMGLLRNGATDHARGHMHPATHGDPPGHGLTDRLRTTPLAGPIGASARPRAPPRPLPPDPDAVGASNRSGPAHWDGDAPYLSASGPEGTLLTTPPNDLASPGTSLEGGARGESQGWHVPFGAFCQALSP